MKFVETNLKGVYVIEPAIYEDDRGHFLEAFREKVFEERGLIFRYVQDNISTSVKGVVRGLHYQKEPFTQAKLVMAVKGEILDVAVDIRKGSPTFGQHFSIELNDKNRRMMLIPPGFAHGFSVLSDETTVFYKCSGYYNKEHERGIRWNDPALQIDWKVTHPIISDKDQRQPFLGELPDEDLF